MLTKGWYPLCLGAVPLKLYCIFELPGDLVKTHVSELELEILHVLQAPS